MCIDILDELSTAEELLNWLDRGKWGNDPVQWMFRGQRDAKWHLAPSSWRGDAWLLSSSQKWLQGKELKTSWEQCAAEYSIIRRFFRMCDVQGLPLPGDTPELRHSMTTDEGLNHLSEHEWPPRDLEWIIATAQHYGIPTRFIDWTRKPLIAAWIAAWFAAEGVVRQLDTSRTDSETGYFAIWALKRDSSQLNAHNWYDVSAPRSEVPNLHLQSGRFIYQRVTKEQYRNTKVTTPFCQESFTHNNPGLLKGVKVPWTEAGKMLRLLRDHFIQAATVYAGYDGVAKSVFEHRFRE